MASSRRRVSRFIPQLESLEDRTVPAGTLATTFANGVLTITGQDNADPALEHQNFALLGAGAGHVSISARDGETIVGKNSFNKVKQIVLKLNEGNDTVSVVDLRINKLGNVLKYQGGEGDNTLLFDGTKIDLTKLNVTGGSGTFTMAPSFPVKMIFGSIDINLPDSQCDITLGGAIVNGATKMVTGDTTDDIIEMDDNTFRGAVTLLTGGGNDTITMGHLDQGDGEELIFQGAVNINCGAGNDSLTAGVTVHDPMGGDDDVPDFTRFLSTVSMIGGDNTDTIEVHHPRSTAFSLDDAPELDFWEVIVYNP